MSIPSSRAMAMRAPIRQIIMAVVLTLLPGAANAALQNPPPASQADLPSDQARRHEQVVTRNGQDYVIELGGNIDGTMTRDPISYQPYVQGWQPNISVRMENIGTTDIVNPWITVNGRGDWRTLKSIVAEAVGSVPVRASEGDRLTVALRTTTQAETARAIWDWQRNHRFHACTWDAEVSDAVKAVNVYGYTLCQDEMVIIRDLWLAAGFKTRPGRPVGHGVTEVFYDGGFHLLDSDEHVIALARDNKAIVSEADVVRDHDLLKRTHTYGISAPEDRLIDEFSASLYGFRGDRGPAAGKIGTKHAMHFTLRPGEALEWRFSGQGKEYSGGTEQKPGEKWKGDRMGGVYVLTGGEGGPR